MMDLEGSLSVFEPVSVFQMMNIAQVTGELTIDNGQNAARIYFYGGDLVFAEISERSVKLGEFLVQRGIITQKKLDSVLVRDRKGKRIGNLLVERGILDKASLFSALEEQVKEVIYEVVRWNKGVFQFESGKTAPNREIVINIPLDHLMLEGVKRMDEEGEAKE